jgi:hypothetical protein
MTRTLMLCVLLISLPAPGRAQEEGASPAASAAPSAKASAAPNRMALHEGDTVAGIGEDSKVRVMKIVKINFQNGDRILHCLAYKESFNKVADAQAAYDRKANFTVETVHLPIDGEGMTPEANKILGNSPVTKPELAGYEAYVKEMSK